MKLGSGVYHLNTFDVPKNEGVKEWAGVSRIQKTNKKCHKINKILPLTWPNNSLQNAMKVGIFLMPSLRLQETNNSCYLQEINNIC